MSYKQENNNPFNKENPFKVPDNYFDSLSDKIFERISESENINKKPAQIISWKKQIAMAAAIVGIIFMSYSGYKILNKQDHSQNQFSQIIDTTDAEYSFVDENFIVEALTTNQPETDVEGEDIIDFLVDENVDENLIADAY